MDGWVKSESLDELKATVRDLARLVERLEGDAEASDARDLIRQAKLLLSGATALVWEIEAD